MSDQPTTVDDEGGTSTRALALEAVGVLLIVIGVTCGWIAQSLIDDFEIGTAVGSGLSGLSSWSATGMKLTAFWDSAGPALIAGAVFIVGGLLIETIEAGRRVTVSVDIDAPRDGARDPGELASPPVARGSQRAAHRRVHQWIPFVDERAAQDGPRAPGCAYRGPEA